MTKTRDLTIIYRCSEKVSHQEFRPPGFSKINCAESFFSCFGFYETEEKRKLIIVHDGEEGELVQYFSNKNSMAIFKYELIKINERSNIGSLNFCLDYAKENVDTEYIYFCEDDYLYHSYADFHMFDGLESFPDSIISLYDHPDRYTRSDDIGDVKVKLGRLGHWRTGESTTCTWATNTELFKKILYKPAKIAGLDDRGFFRSIYTQNGIRLHTPIPGYATHCHIPFLSPYFKEL